MIDLNNVSKRVSKDFGVQDLNFTVHAGEILGVLGPNGAGKTTLIRLLAGLYRPDHGVIRYTGASGQDAIRDPRRLTGTVTDRLHLYPWLSLLEYLHCCAELYQLKHEQWHPRAMEALSRFGLLPHANTKTAQLSHGMKQKLNFVRAMLHHPSILLLDEPTLGLDPMSVRVLSEYVREFVRTGGCVVLCTHDLVFASRMCSRVLVLSQGRMISQLEVQTSPYTHSIDYTLNDNNKAAVLESQVATVIECSISSERPGRYRLSYQAARDQSVHHQIIKTLLSIEAVIEDFSADPADQLESLYRQVPG